jgi:hypothetical protein
MCSGVVLAEMVSLVEGTLAPQNVELPLSDLVAHPAELHVHCLGPFPFDEIAGNAGGRVVASFNSSQQNLHKTELLCPAVGS